MGFITDRVSHVVGILALACVVFAPELRAEKQATPFSLSVGTQSIGIRYKFTNENGLVESAKEIALLGCDTLKIALTPHYVSDYQLSRDAQIRSLNDLVRLKPSYTEVMDMPFRNILLWVYPFSDTKSAFNVGKISDSEAEAIYREMYDFTAFVLRRYSGSGKSFFFGNWEGDWHVLRENFTYNLDPEPESLQGAIQWFNLREKAVADARRDTPHSDVNVYYYIELNHVRKTMEEGKPSIVNRVLPYIRTDYVSWSSYDVSKPAAILGGEKGKDLFFKALDFIEAHLPPSDVKGKRVFIGEYGFELTSFHSPERQNDLTASIMKWSLEWGCPFVLYWELYCNEVDPDSGQNRGYWLIDNKGVKQPVWFLHQRFLARARTFVNDYKCKHGELPDQKLYNQEAAKWIDDIASAPAQCAEDAASP